MQRGTVYLETFGCQMNELDSELVAGSLSSLGYRFTDDAAAADVVLYNTCSVREHAEQKVWSRLGELAIRKRTEPGLVVGVLGCMAERDGAPLIRRMPVVDILCGPGELDKLPGLVDNAVRTRAGMIESDGASDFDGETISANLVALQGSTSRRTATLAAAEDTLELLDLSRAISPIDSSAMDGVGGRHSDHAAGGKRSAYVRITRGCNKFCTYCVVPFTRGAEVHRPPEHIVEECRRLADAGVIEITLLGQTVNHYRFEHGAAVSLGGIVQPQKGRAFTGGHSRDPLAGVNVTTFADLLAMIHDRVPAIKRLRFVTSYPRDFGDDVLEVMRDHERICRYLHVPAQTGSDRLLKSMNRGYTVGEYIEFIDRARAILDQPELGRPLTMSGDFIVGFPGETDEDFDASVALIRRARYKNAFIFKYSLRPGTVAFDKLPDNVPEDVKRRRNNELLAIQNTISDEISKEQIGRELDVFVEGPSRRQAKKDRTIADPDGACSSKGTISLTVNGRGTTRPSDAVAVADEDAIEPDEAPTATSTIQYAGRTDGDLIVFFDAPAPGADAPDLSGSILRMKIVEASALALFGRRMPREH